MIFGTTQKIFHNPYSNHFTRFVNPTPPPTLLIYIVLFTTFCNIKILVISIPCLHVLGSRTVNFLCCCSVMRVPPLIEHIFPRCCATLSRWANDDPSSFLGRDVRCLFWYLTSPPEVLPKRAPLSSDLAHNNRQVDVETWNVVFYLSLQTDERIETNKG